MNGRRNWKKSKKEKYKRRILFYYGELLQKINLRTQIIDLIKIYYSLISP